MTDGFLSRIHGEVGSGETRTRGAGSDPEAVRHRARIGEPLDLLWRYHQMLREANARLNLTRIHNFENMVLKHYVDSLLVLRFVELPSPLIDMGSGPGLPGIPLKIARPGVRMILAEPRGARADFLARGLRAARPERTWRSTPTRSARIIRARWRG